MRVDLRALEAGPIELAAELAPDDAALGPLERSLRGPVRVSGRITESGQGQYFWDGRIRVTVDAQCRRCLTPVEVPVDAPVRVLFSAAQDAGDDPSVYLVPARATELDLGAAVREELILAIPEYVVCREECRGICPRCGADLNRGPCDCRPEPDARWRALEALKGLRSDDDQQKG